MRTTHRRPAVAAAALLLTAGAAPAVADDGHSHGRGEARGTLLSADLIGSLTTDPDPDIANVEPGGADWSVSRSTVKVKANGRVDIRVRDLVLTRTGANPVPTISAGLVCNGAVVDTVGPVPYDSEGDARIRDRSTVPDRCLAPAVLLNPVDQVGTYIAVSGHAR